MEKEIKVGSRVREKISNWEGIVLRKAFFKDWVVKVWINASDGGYWETHAFYTSELERA